MTSFPPRVSSPGPEPRRPSLDGRVNIDPQHPDKMLSGVAGSNRAVRGGGWVAEAYKGRASYRFGQDGKNGSVMNRVNKAAGGVRV